MIIKAIGKINSAKHTHVSGIAILEKPEKIFE